MGILSIDLKTVMLGRVRGVAKELESAKRPLKQAPILTSDMVYKLEMLMHNTATNEACILGFLLFCLFASARFADATKCKDMTLEEFEHVVEDFQRCRQHKISGVVHLLNARAELSCGRSWSRNYGPPLFDIHESGWQTFCQQCAKTLEK